MLLEEVDMCSLLKTAKIPCDTMGTGAYRICFTRCVGLIKYLINALQ